MDVKDRAEEVQLMPLLTIVQTVQRVILIHAHAGLKNFLLSGPLARTCLRVGEIVVDTYHNGRDCNAFGE